ncbi:predicted protein [Botrytis cinerea T4]|uniref:Uncharacterized protein n=1 Tax=Botryotinia fuckeliana (strain T4) TaxID=999810 RepID=G2XTN9_BOTF4|nr:predicted protein [Botrytis cinerea T4]
MYRIDESKFVRLLLNADIMNHKIQVPFTSYDWSKYIERQQPDTRQHCHGQAPNPRLS